MGTHNSLEKRGAAWVSRRQVRSKVESTNRPGWPGDLWNCLRRRRPSSALRRGRNGPTKHPGVRVFSELASVTACCGRAGRVLHRRNRAFSEFQVAREQRPFVLSAHGTGSVSCSCIRRTNDICSLKARAVLQRMHDVHCARKARSSVCHSRAFAHPNQLSLNLRDLITGLASQLVALPHRQPLDFLIEQALPPTALPRGNCGHSCIQRMPSKSSFTPPEGRRNNAPIRKGSR